MQKSAGRSEGGNPNPASTMPFEHFAIVCAAWIAPSGRSEKGYLVARRVSDTEVVLYTHGRDGTGPEESTVVTLPHSVAAKVRPYDLDELA
jgi:hypothetical protein